MLDSEELRSMTGTRLVELRENIRDKICALADKINAEQRAFTPEEEREWQRLNREWDMVRMEIESKPQEFVPGTPEYRANINRVLGRNFTTPAEPFGADTPDALYDYKAGRSIPLLGPQDRLSDRIDADLKDRLECRNQFGAFVRALALGDRRGTEKISRFMSESQGSAGGFTVPEVLSAEIIDLARNRAQVIQAGARTFPMDGADVVLAKVTGDPTAVWRGEGEAITSSDMAFGRVVLRSRTVAAIVPVSIELLEDSMNIADVVRNAVAQSLALAMDLAALRGDNVKQPLGLRNLDGVNEIDKAASTMNYSDVSNAVMKIAEANGSGNAVIMPPKIFYGLDRLLDGQGNPARPMDSFANLQKLVTNQIPTDLGAGSDETEVYVGEWRWLYWGVRTNLRLEILRSGTVGTDDAAEKMLVWIRAYMRGDAYAVRPDHFTRIIGVTGVG